MLKSYVVPIFKQALKENNQDKCFSQKEIKYTDIIRYENFEESFFLLVVFGVLTAMLKTFVGLFIVFGNVMRSSFFSITFVSLGTSVLGSEKRSNV